VVPAASEPGAAADPASPTVGWVGPHGTVRTGVPVMAGCAGAAPSPALVVRDRPHRGPDPTTVRAVGVVRGIGSVSAGLLLLVGCTTGPPLSTPPSGPAGTAPPAAAPSTVALPPRPREVRVDGVDPCSLLTPQVRAEQGLTQEPRSGRGYTALYRGEIAQCSVTGFAEPDVAVGLGLSTTAGVEVFDPRNPDATYTVTEVRGFPALVASLGRFPEFCTVAVDVAPGQVLDVQFRDGGNVPPLAQPELCRRAQLIAEAAMIQLAE
jgi:hypothetical protein